MRAATSSGARRPLRHPDPRPHAEEAWGEGTQIGHTGAWVPRGTGGRAQTAGVSESCAAWRTNVMRPNGVSISSSRSAMSADLGSGQAKPFCEASEPCKPMAGLRQGDAHVPRPALARLAGQRHHRPERHQVARGVIERLGGQLLGPWKGSGGLGLGVVEAARGLHQRVEAAPRCPGPGVAVGRQRDGDDAGLDLGAGLGREAELGEPAGAVALHEDVRLAQQRGQPLALLVGAQVERRRRACRGRYRCRARPDRAGAAR